MKRTIFAVIIISLLFAGAVAAIVKCTLMNEGVVDALSAQYNKSVLYTYPRGIIYDRNGIAFTNRSDGDLSFLTVSDSVGGVAFYVTGELSSNDGDTTSSACHGVNGLQKAYDKILSGGTPINVSASVDASGNILKDYGYTVDNDHPNEGGNITTTLDYNLQKAFEDELAAVAAEKGYEGLCAVMTEVDTGRIVAMASYGGYLNKTVLSYQPGSVMKIVTAAAALDEGLVSADSLYECSGTVKVDDSERHCASDAVHGTVSVKQAFALSCNCCFYELAKNLIYKDADGSMRSKALDLAEKWGFAEYGDEPEDGFVLNYGGHYSFVESDLYNEMDIFNAALGQGKIQASPYLINRITAAIASGGKITEPHIVMKVTDAAGNTIESEEKEVFDLGLAEGTVTALRDMMCLTAESGTAARMNTLGDMGGFAGKTGTAENISGQKAHAWFTGYFPAEEPAYALTVLIENGGSAPSSAVYLFDSLVHCYYDIFPYKNNAD